MPIGIAERAAVPMKDGRGINPTRAGKRGRRARIHNPGTEVFAPWIVLLHPQESFSQMFQVRCVAKLRCFTIQGADGGEAAVSKSSANPQLCSDIGWAMKNARVGGILEKRSLSVALLNYQNQALLLRC